MTKRILTIVIVIAVAFLVALPKLGLFKKGSDQPGGAQAARASTLPVEGYLLRATSFDNTLIITGSIIANESLELKSEASGKITNINFKEGAKVRQGDLLVQTNDEEIRAMIEKQRYMQKLSKDIEFRQRQLLKKHKRTRR